VRARFDRPPVRQKGWARIQPILADLADDLPGNLFDADADVGHDRVLARVIVFRWQADLVYWSLKPLEWSIRNFEVAGDANPANE
jgi:hypothetical protein